MFGSRSTTGVALCALLAPFALGSCVADSVSLRITCNVVPEGDCTYTGGNTCYLVGGLNLAQIAPYYAVLQVTNGLKARERDVPPQSEPNGVTIDEVEVEITDSAGQKPALGSLPNPFTVQATGYAEPDSDALVGAELVPGAYVSVIRSLAMSGRLSSIRLSVIARGETDGRVEVETAPWPWNIRLYNVSADPASGQCLALEDSVCTLGQDQWVDACDPAKLESN